MLRLSGRHETLLNTATVLATIGAVAVVSSRLGLREPSRAVPPAPQRVVDKWESYATGARLRVSPSGARPEVVIVEFSDFQCTYCREAAKTLERLQHNYPDKVAVFYRHYPLKRSSLDAAIASECARRAGHFDAMHAALFAKPDSFGIRPWSSYAKDAGMRDTLAFNLCLRDTTAFQVIVKDVRDARDLGVSGTPTFLVNGELFAGSPGYNHFVRIIRRHAERASNMTSRQGSE